MVGYMSLEEQVDADFTRARTKAFLRRIGARLRRGAVSNRLPCFEEVRTIRRAVGGIYRGRRTVPLGQIAGSVGRCSEFDRGFLPAKASVGERWMRIDRALHRGEGLPPVSLYKIGGFYFILDGNHRVSVSRYHGVEWIDAEVTEFRAPSGAPSPSEPARPRTIERTKEHAMSNKQPGREDSKERENAAPTEGIEVRWGLEEDEARTSHRTV